MTATDKLIWIAVQLKVICGEYEFYCNHTSQIVKTKNFNLTHYSEKVAREFYGKASYRDKYTGSRFSYYFFGGEVSVTVSRAERVSESVYETLTKWGY